MISRTYRNALASTIALLASPVAGEDAKYYFTLSLGAGFPVCEALLAAAQAAPPEVVGKCDFPPPGFENEPPGQFINWQILREGLGAGFRVPAWHRLDASKRADLETATFALAITNGPLLASSFGPDGWGSWSSILSDDEIWSRVRRYIDEGGLPHDLLQNPGVLKAAPPFRFSSAEFDYGGTKDEAIKLEVVTELPKICFEERADPYTTIVIFQPETAGHGPGEAEPHDQNDIVMFSGELYAVRYSYGGRNTGPRPLFVTAYERGKHYNTFPANTSICTLELRLDRN